MTSPAPASNGLVDACKTLMKELERNGTTAPEELMQAQDLLETIDRNAERIAAALAESRRRRKTGDEGLGAIAGLLREQDQFFQQVRTHICIWTSRLRS
jgi:hypothetical protein